MKHNIDGCGLDTIDFSLGIVASVVAGTVDELLDDLRGGIFEAECARHIYFSKRINKS